MKSSMAVVSAWMGDSEILQDFLNLVLLKRGLYFLHDFGISCNINVFL